MIPRRVSAAAVGLLLFAVAATALYRARSASSAGSHLLSVSDRTHVLEVDAMGRASVDSPAGWKGWIVSEDESCRDLRIGDLDADGTDEIVVASEREGRGRVAVWKWNGTGLEEITSFGDTLYHPFLVRIGDADDDGSPDVLVGLEAPALADRSRLTRKFHMFKFQDGRLQMYWFTERMAEDFSVIEVGGRKMLLEISRFGNRWQINLYKWETFGFWLEERLAMTDERASILEERGEAYVVNDRGTRMRVVAGANGPELRSVRRGGDES